MSARRVVVVDSGVDPHHPALRARCRVLPGLGFDAGGAQVALRADQDLLGHGTAVAATIVRFCASLPEPVELVPLRVFDADASCDFAAVLHALRHAATRSPALVNLSLGTTSLRHRDALEAAIAALRDAGARVVAPASYAGLPCDPGNLPGVEAVVADPNVLPMLPELRPVRGRLVWFASPQPPPDRDGVVRLRTRGDSLAVAAVSGALLRTLPG
ncbi:MAG: S8/S53 family peptidase [Planctomycetes bacterium]|nr:S8/S53 family peptidase [Planctomycetota bacterium]